ncbi:hypothetical protein VTI74DRAFT_9616 [Chaetomium olivicolor]
MEDGTVHWHWPESGYLLKLTDEEHEQFEMTYPPDNEAVFFVDKPDHHTYHNSEHEDDGHQSVASSAFISDPEDLDLQSTPELYVRPSNPEPTADNDETQPTNGRFQDIDNDEDNNQQIQQGSSQPIFSTRFLEADSYNDELNPLDGRYRDDSDYDIYQFSAPASPAHSALDGRYRDDSDYDVYEFSPAHSSASDDTPNHELDADALSPAGPEPICAVNPDEDLVLDYPISPYKLRRTPDSWTGLEETQWGCHSYISTSGHLHLNRQYEIESGVCHGLLMKCRWGGYRDREQAVQSVVGLGICLTTPEGEEYWLDDVWGQYNYEIDYDWMKTKEYGHACGDGCWEFLEEYGWEHYRRRKNVVVYEGEEMHPEEAGGSDDHCGHLSAIAEEDEETETEDEAVEQVVGKGVGFKPWSTPLSVIAEEDEAEEEAAQSSSTPSMTASSAPSVSDEEADDGDLEDFSFIDEELLERIAGALLEETEEALVPNTFILEDENRNPAVCVIEDDNEQHPHVAESINMAYDDKLKEEELPLWIRDPTYISKKTWAELDEEYEEWKKAQEEAAKEKLPLWIRDPTYISGKSWAELEEEDDEY